MAGLFLWSPPESKAKATERGDLVQVASTFDPSLSLFAVCRRFSLQPSCHPAVFLLSSFSLLSLLPLSRRSPLPRSAAPPPPVGPLLSRLLLPLGAVPLSSLRIVAPQVYPAHLSRERLF